MNYSYRMNRCVCLYRKGFTQIIYWRIEPTLCYIMEKYLNTRRKRRKAWIKEILHLLSDKTNPVKTFWSLKTQIFVWISLHLILMFCKWWVDDSEALRLVSVMGSAQFQYSMCQSLCQMKKTMWLMTSQIFKHHSCFIQFVSFESFAVICSSDTHISGTTTVEMIIMMMMMMMIIIMIYLNWYQTPITSHCDSRNVTKTYEPNSWFADQKTAWGKYRKSEI